MNDVRHAAVQRKHEDQGFAIDVDPYSSSDDGKAQQLKPEEDADLI